MTDWQPIESAPKDGTIILIAKGRYVFAAYWSQCPMATGGSAEYPWVFLDETNGVNGYIGDENGPSHWQPLPKPPESAA